MLRAQPHDCSIDSTALDALNDGENDVYMHGIPRPPRRLQLAGLATHTTGAAAASKESLTEHWPGYSLVPVMPSTQSTDVFSLVFFLVDFSLCCESCGKGETAVLHVKSCTWKVHFFLSLSNDFELNLLFLHVCLSCSVCFCLTGSN